MSQGTAIFFDFILLFIYEKNIARSHLFNNGIAILLHLEMDQNKTIKLTFVKVILDDNFW